jgi:uncharacterized protein YjbJ (UPF0337 family)
MNKNQIEGSIKKVAGKIQQKVGEAVGSTDQQVKGAGKRLEGTFQKGIGDVKQAVKRPLPYPTRSRNQPKTY